MTDAELVRAIQAGKTDALEVLYQRYLPSVWRYAYAHLSGNVHAAEDVTSETFLAAVRGITAIDPEGGPVGGWLTGIARHKVGDHRRRAYRVTSELTNAHAEASTHNDPASALETAERRATVLETMDKMPDDERIVLEWKYLDAVSVREISARLGRTEKAVEALLYRARGSFRKLFEQRQENRS